MNGRVAMQQTQEAAILTAELSQSFEVCSIYNFEWHHAPLHLSTATVWTFASFRTDLNERIIAVVMSTTQGLTKLEFSYFAIIRFI